ncbi:MAG: nucleotidyltransferase family protein [Suilimivivens sp.]
MKTAAIIAEYNPFHEGHKYQIEETRYLTDADFILVLMSGDFVQRGAPAIFNKYHRTQMALLGGADVVIELPSLYAVSSAEFFAEGSVALLNRLGIVDYLSFGSECGDINLIQNCAGLLVADFPEYNHALSFFIKQGYSFPVARNKAVLQTACHSGTKQIADGHSLSEEAINTLFTSPNNILAIEYCKSLLAANSPITPITIKRQGAGYHETSLQKESAVFNSASAIRAAIEKGNTDADYLTANDFSSLLHYRLLTERDHGFTRYLDCSNNLSDKIVKNLPDYTDFTGFCSLLKSKDITYTRISRVLTHILLGITAPDSFSQPLFQRKLSVPYARLLGFRKESKALLSSIKKNSSVPLISKLADATVLLDQESSALQMLKQDILASDIYEAVYSHKYKKRLLNEYKQSPIIY